MNHEVVFRVAVAGVLVTFFGVGAFMGVRFRWSRGNVVTRREGRLKLGALGFLFLAWVSASVAFVVNPAWMSWSALPLPASLRWTGVGVVVVTFSLALLAFLSLGTNYSGSVVIKDSHTLVTSGPYRWIRHPIYTSYFALTLSLFLLTTNWFIGLALLALSILLASRVEGEEALLLERFGDGDRSRLLASGPPS